MGSSARSRVKYPKGDALVYEVRHPECVESGASGEVVFPHPPSRRNYKTQEDYDSVLARMYTCSRCSKSVI